MRSRTCTCTCTCTRTSPSARSDAFNRNLFYRIVRLDGLPARTSADTGSTISGPAASAGTKTSARTSARASASARTSPSAHPWDAVTPFTIV